MASPSSQIPLPPSVERLLRKICERHSQPPPDATARRQLASLGEELSLDILTKICACPKIRTLSCFIMFMAKQARTASSRETTSFSRISPQPATPASSSTAISPPSVAATHSLSPEHLVSSSPMILKNTSGGAFSPQLVALGELEFRKAFLILSYRGRQRLEDVISANRIRELKDFPMERFELELWNTIGRNFIDKEDRQRSLDWNSGKAHFYHCFVHPNGSYTFKGPYLNKQRTHLQRVLGDDNVLIVKFSDVTDHYSDVTSAYSSIGKEGILVGLRRYRFFVFKDGGKEEKKKNPTSSPVKCFFVRMESSAAVDNDCYILSKKTISEARSLFMHIHTVSSVAKYMARFSLILSKTIKLDVDLTSVHIERIDDVPCRNNNGSIVKDEDGKPLIHTDGTGFISKDLALKCPLNVYKGKCFNSENSKRFLEIAELEGLFLELSMTESGIREPPLLIQFRLFYNGCAVKGTLLVNQELPPRTIQIRPSMIKVEADAKFSNIRTENSFEIVTTSNQPRKTNMSRYLIALLSYGGVPRDYFMQILVNALEEAQSAYSSKRAALRIALHYGEMDDFMVSKMILSGVPLDEPFMQHRLSILLNEEKKVLKGGRIPVSECFYLMGTADPTGELERDDVCIILDSGQISGKVLVFKHPGLHFGDIHVLNARHVKAIGDIVGNAKYAIFFSTKGSRSIADEMANSDFDGDIYWVSRNPQLLDCFKASKPWTQSYSTQNISNKKPSEFSAEDLELELFHLFLTTRFKPSIAVGVAADSWLVFMDRLLTMGDDCADEKKFLKRKMLKLIDIYYCALDAPKTGMKIEVPMELKPEKYPHFLERKNSYKSKSILGQIYDAVESFQMAKLARLDIWKLPCLDDEVPEVYVNRWKEYYVQYRRDMANALRHDAETRNAFAGEVMKKYKQLLYEAAEFEDSAKNMNQIFQEALAIYHVCYDFAKDRGAVGYCSFAWKVAGSALCKLYAMKQEEKSIICLPSVLRELFG